MVAERVRMGRGVVLGVARPVWDCLLVWVVRDGVGVVGSSRWLFSSVSLFSLVGDLVRLAGGMMMFYKKRAVFKRLKAMKKSVY